MHVRNFCRKKGCGLARFLEQAFEAVHARFFKFSRYGLSNNLSDPGYGQKLLKTVMAFNVLRLC